MSTIDELNVKITADSSQFKKEIGAAESSTSTFGSKVASVAKSATVAFASIATAVTAVGTKIVSSVLDSYGEYEQLVGGVETLFGDSAPQLMEYANNAYKTAGVSANEYMENVTSFSASLLQSLDGDTESAVKYADLAMTDMSDNANKMGTSMESIQNAYQGFAKDNYTMLDNLKLGYGGTKSEMERLIEDANSLKEAQGELGNLTIDSYADIVEAIHTVQSEMGITGTTAEEAETTIQGSINSTKAAWNNLITGLGDSNANIKKLCSNVIKEAKNVVKNVLPVIKQVASAVPELVETISDELPELIGELLPVALEAVGDLFDAIVDALPNIIETITKMIPKIIESIIKIIKKIVSNISKIIKPIIDALPNVLDAIITGITEDLPDIVKDLSTAVGKIVGELVKKLPDLLLALVKAIPSAIASGLTSIGESIVGLFTGLFDVEIDIGTTPNVDMSETKQMWQTKLDEIEAELESFEPIDIDFDTIFTASGRSYSEVEAEIDSTMENINTILTQAFANQKAEFDQNIADLEAYKARLEELYAEETSALTGFVSQQIALMQLDTNQSYTELKNQYEQLLNYAEQTETVINDQYDEEEKIIRNEALAYGWSTEQLATALATNEQNRKNALADLKQSVTDGAAILDNKAITEAQKFSTMSQNYDTYYANQKAKYEAGEIDLKTFKENCATYWDGFATDIDASTLAAAGSFITYCDSVIASGGTLSDTEKKTMKGLLSFFDGLPEEYKEDATNMLSSLIDGVDLKSDAVKTAFENIGTDGIDSIKSAFGISGDGKSKEFEDIATNTVAAMTKVYADAGSRHGTGTIGWAIDILVNGGLIDNIKKALGIHSPSTVFRDIGENTVTGLINGLNNKKDSLSSTIASIASDAKSSISSVSSGSWSVGYDSIQGLINGAEYQRWSLIGKFQNLAYSAWSSVKSILGINSPSKMFAELGEYSAEGFGVGFTDEMNDTIHSINAQTASISSAISFPSLDGYYSLASTLNMEVSDNDRNTLLAEQNSILKQLLNKESTINVASILSAQSRANRRTGKLVLA